MDEAICRVALLEIFRRFDYSNFSRTRKLSLGGLLNDIEGIRDKSVTNEARFDFRYMNHVYLEMNFVKILIFSVFTQVILD